MDPDLFGPQSSSGSRPEAEAEIDKMLNSMDQDALLQMLLKKILMQEMKEKKLLTKIKSTETNKRTARKVDKNGE